MQILYVIGIMIISVFTLESLVTSQGMRTNASAVYKMQAEGMKITWQLSRSARLAYETSVKNSGVCPAGTTSYSPPGTTDVNLCWGADMQNNCFSNVLGPTGKQVCLRSGQPPVGLNSLFVSKAYAAAPPNHHVHFGGYNGITNPNPTPLNNGPQNGAFVRLPQANAGPNVTSNHIDCTTNYTECFSVIYCIDGTNNCGNAGMVIQTFATRWF